jgi:hypothetical protein
VPSGSYSAQANAAPSLIGLPSVSAQTTLQLLQRSSKLLLRTNNPEVVQSGSTAATQ